MSAVGSHSFVTALVKRHVIVPTFNVIQHYGKSALDVLPLFLVPPCTTDIDLTQNFTNFLEKLLLYVLICLLLIILLNDTII